MAKYLPLGTTFSINGQVVGGLVSITIPERTRGEGETTDSASTMREFIPGLRDGGSVTITMRHNPTDLGQQMLETLYDTDGSGAVVECIITLPAAAGSRTYTFDAFVSTAPSGELGLTEDEAAQQTAVVRVSGPVTIAP